MDEFIKPASATAWVLRGLDVVPVKVTASPGTGTGGLRIPQLSGVALRESTVRIRSALSRVGLLVEQPVDITIDPLPPTVSMLDLAIAVAVLATCGRVPTYDLHTDVFCGELSLQGSPRAIRGGVPLAHAALGLDPGKLILPFDNSADASLVEAHKQVRLARTLQEVVQYLRYKRDLLPVQPVEDQPTQCDDSPWADLRDARVRRAIEIAAAGGHSLLLVAPPGSGKTLAARALATLLPIPDDFVDVASIWSVAGLPWPSSVPFRAPHHTVSEAGLVGGGTVPRPGEVSLAHGGVLFLDEFGEFRMGAIEALGQVLREGFVHLGRRPWACSYPARPAVVMAASNPCPCGGTSCKCTPESIARYRERLRRLSFDLVVRVPRFDYLAEAPPVEPIADVRLRIAVAREELDLLEAEDRSVARTIAELEGSNIEDAHVAEAGSFGWDAAGL